MYGRRFNDKDGDKPMKQFNWNEQGFTLIELIVTITIIVILSGSAIAGYYNFSQRQAAMNDARNLATELKKVQSLAKNLVYPGDCGGLKNYKMTPVCTGVDCRSVKIVATCASGGDANGEIVVKESEEVLQKASFPASIGTFTFSAGSGVIAPTGSFDLYYLNDSYKFQVVIYANGNISVIEK